MSQRLPVNGFKWVKELSKLNESFIKGYDENIDRGYFLEVDVEYQNKLFNLYRDLPLLLERKKIKRCNKLVCNIQDKENYAVHIAALKQTLNHGWMLKKVHRLIQFN